MVLPVPPLPPAVSQEPPAYNPMGSFFYPALSERSLITFVKEVVSPSEVCRVLASTAQNRPSKQGVPVCVLHACVFLDYLA